jgi:hypothetical protein
LQTEETEAKAVPEAKEEGAATEAWAVTEGTGWPVAASLVGEELPAWAATVG